MEYFIVITGASRGFGQAVAFSFLDFISNNSNGSDIVHGNSRSKYTDVNSSNQTTPATISDGGGTTITNTVTTDTENETETTTTLSSDNTADYHFTGKEKNLDPTNDCNNVDPSSLELSSIYARSTVIHYFLLAKDPIGLNQTRDIIMEKCNTIKERNTSTKSTFDVSVSLFPGSDLSNLNTLDSIINNVFDEMTVKLSLSSSQNRQKNIQKWILINNAGTLGFVGDAVHGMVSDEKCTSGASHPHLSSSTNFTLQDMKECIDLNVTSSCWFAVRFIKHFTMLSTTSLTNSATTTGTTPNSNLNNKLRNATLDIVNISSLTAIQPFPTMAIYSACKAARDMYTKCLALEQNEKCNQRRQHEQEKLQHSNEIRFLNYAPGPLETDMTNILRTTDGLSETLKPHYINKQLIEPIDSATKLVQLLLLSPNKHNPKSEHTTTTATTSMKTIEYFNISFQSGDHVDYYDIP